MTADLTNPVFQDEDSAREHFERLLWPDGPVCPHCGNANLKPEHKFEDGGNTHIAKMKGKSHRAGLYWCFACEDSFSVTVGTVMERSHIPLHKWALAFHLMVASKKGISAHQLHRMLGIAYKSAWFMCHRIREAMRDDAPSPLGGAGKSVEADETYFGRREGETRGHGGKGKRAVVALVERGGKSRAFHVVDVSSLTIPALLRANTDARSKFYTDEAKVYIDPGKRFASHKTVKHSVGEYVRGDAHTNTIEGYFSIFKRGMKGIYQHCGEQHLQRYLHEFDFRYSNRIALGVDDKERAARAVKGAEGKRLTYHATKGERK